MYIYMYCIYMYTKFYIAVCVFKSLFVCEDLHKNLKESRQERLDLNT